MTNSDSSSAAAENTATEPTQKPVRKKSINQKSTTSGTPSILFGAQYVDLSLLSKENKEALTSLLASGRKKEALKSEAFLPTGTNTKSEPALSETAKCSTKASRTRSSRSRVESAQE
jgi:hypothetical protein